ncbi:MAG: hypothetical protein ACRD9S_19120 [Pyrinomonadaceae bacterium]
MRYLSVLVVCAAFFLSELAPASIPAIVSAQTGAQGKAASLRAQLIEVETKQAELQTRLQNLDEQLQPENTERALAGVGSTHPEDLREQRRRQLEIQRNGVRAQLDLLTTSHSRLETAIARADAEAYRQSASPVTANTTTPGGPSIEQAAEVTTQVRRRRVRKKRIKKSGRRHHVQNSLD